MIVSSIISILGFLCFCVGVCLLPLPGVLVAVGVFLMFLGLLRSTESGRVK